MAHTDWTEHAAYMKFVQGKSWGDVYRAYPEHKPEAIRARLRRMPEYTEHRTAKAGNVEFIDLPQPSSDNIMDYWDTLRMAQEYRERERFVQSEAVIPIHDDKPIGIVQTGDWHIGADGFDFESFNTDIPILKDTDGLFVVGGGDYIDNETPSVHGSNPTNMTDRQMQWELAKHFMWELEEKWLGITLGCHIDWDIKTSGKDPVEQLCKEMQKPYLQYGGTMYIDLNGIEYSYMLRHKYRSESKTNPSNAQRVMAESFGKRDIVGLAHLHFPDMHVSQKEGSPITYLRSGSYKIGDSFGRKIGGYKGVPEFPMVIMFPDQKKMLPFRNFHDGLYTLEKLRS